MKNAEQVMVYNNFITHKVLRELTENAFKGSTADTLNIYIDMYKMMIDLYEPQLEIKNTTIITSTMVNLCAHLRSYFWNHHRVNTNIFLVYSNMSDKYSKTYYPNYNSGNDLKISTNDRITGLINDNANLLEILCPYLPDIYFVRGIHEPAAIILDLIFKEEATGNLSPNLVFTRDDIAMQIPACNPNTTIYLNSKRTGVSLYSNFTNAIPIYLLKTGRKRLLENQGFVDKISCMSSQHIGTLIALTNLPSRNVKSEYDINKAINILYSAITRKSIINSYMSNPLDIYNGLFVGEESKLSPNSFEFRYKAVDLMSIYRNYLYSPQSKDVSYKVNLDDSNTVKAINNEYFKDNPLDLNRL